MINNNKLETNGKINLYKENLIKFIIIQKDKIIPIGSIEQIDYIIGILFLTETNRYFKQNKISIHSYYLAYTFINLFNKIRKRIFESYEFNIEDINHFIIALSKNIDYLNSHVDSSNNIKNKININFSKYIIEILPILNTLVTYKKSHNNKKDLKEKNNKVIENSETILKSNDSQKNSKDNTSNDSDIYKYCDTQCYNCLTSETLSKFFYILLQTAKFLGTGIYKDPNLLRISEYYSNIFYTWLKSTDIVFINYNEKNIHTELYENYLMYKNKLNYSLLELNLNSETLDEIMKYLDDDIIENLSIKIK
jgi:hypothetical protein